MNKILMSLSIALVSWALIPASASARPKDCDEVCTCSTICGAVCTLPGGSTVITCGLWDICLGQCAVDPSEETPAMGDGEYSEEDQMCRVREHSMED